MSVYKRTEEEIPENGEQVYCLPQCELLVWNENEYCWDDSDGDDFYCDKYDVEAWCYLPEYDLKD